MFGLPMLQYIGGSSSINAVTFDGINDYLSYSSPLTGASDGKQCLISLWIKTSAQGKNILDTNQSGIGAPVSVQITSEGANTSRAIFNFRDALGNNLVSFTTTSFINNNAYHNILVSFDTTNVAKRFVYVDDSPNAVTWTNYSSAANIKFTATDWAVAASAVSFADRLSADLAEVYFNTTYLDISNTSNRRQFITSSLTPTIRDGNGGFNGSGQPLIWFSGATSSWQTNKGSGGGFTLTGALGNGTLPVQA